MVGIEEGELALLPGFVFERVCFYILPAEGVIPIINAGDANVYLAVVFQRIEGGMQEEVYLYIVLLEHEVVGIIATELGEAQHSGVEAECSFPVAHR